MSFMETCYAYVTITPRKGVPIKCVIECCEDGSGDGASVSCSIKERNLQSIETLDDLIDTLRDNIILDEDDDEYRKSYFTEDNRFVRKLRKEVASLEKVDSIEIVLTKTTSGGNETIIDEINYSFMKKDMDPVLGEDSGTNANNVSNKGQKIKKDDPNINKKKTNADDLRNSYWYQILGEDFIYYAFKAAKAAVDKYSVQYANSYDQRADIVPELFYNDYNEYQASKRDAIIRILTTEDRKSTRLNSSH